MKKWIYRFVFAFLFLGTILSGAFFWWFGTGKGYDVYQTQYEARRMRPDIFPSVLSLKLFDLGHHSMYADFLWIQLIQFVGDNAGGNRFLVFSHKLLQNITGLNPYFARPYEIDLIFTPTLPSDGIDLSNTGLTSPFRSAIEHGKRGMDLLCDAHKLAQIESLPFGPELWEKRTDLRNPCLSGWIPYYIAMNYLQALKDGENAEKYYKIASMHDDTPEASKFLGILARSSAGDYRSSALQFFLVGQSGYDTDPYTCQKKTQDILSFLVQKNQSISWKFIEDVEQFEKTLDNIHDESNPLSLSPTNCVDSFRRGTKQLFLAYVDQESQGLDISRADELVRLGRIPRIPYIRDQSSGYELLKRDGIWRYRMIIKE